MCAEGRVGLVLKGPLELVEQLGAGFVMGTKDRLCIRLLTVFAEERILSSLRLFERELLSRPPIYTLEAPLRDYRACSEIS